MTTTSVNNTTRAHYKTSGQNDIDSQWEKGRWAECGGPSSLTFFHLFSIQKKKKKIRQFLFGHALFLFPPDLPSCEFIGE